MADPRRRRNLAFITLLGAIVAVVIAFKMPDAGQGFAVQAILGIGGLTVLPFSLVLALVVAMKTSTFVGGAI